MHQAGGLRRHAVHLYELVRRATRELGMHPPSTACGKAQGRIQTGHTRHHNFAQVCKQPLHLYRTHMCKAGPGEGVACE